MKILAEDLHRLCYNAQQFSSKDSSLGGVVMFTPEASLAVYASDDYVAMKDEAPIEWDDGSDTFWLGLKELKELEKWLRDKEGPREMFIVDDRFHDDEEEFSVQIVSEPPDFSGVIEVVHREVNPFTGEFSPSAEPFAIRAERFTKFRLLKTPESPSCKDGYPVDFLWDGVILRWKCGPFLKGVVGPLTRVSHNDPVTGEYITGIRELYSEEREVLW